VAVSLGLRQELPQMGLLWADGSYTRAVSASGSKKSEGGG
jgi:hypothetical protein